jgi:hypothetical protein
MIHRGFAASGQPSAFSGQLSVAVVLPLASPAPAEVEYEMVASKEMDVSRL